MKKIPLTQGKFAIVDDEDYERLIKNGKWCIAGTYAIRGVKTLGLRKTRTMTYMHRFILNAPKNMQVDHINGDRLDNRKCNLRICSPAQNSVNRGKNKNNKSGYKGVCWDSNAEKWRAYINVNYKKVHLGLFTCPIEAARRYNEAAIKHHGDFAQLNQIP